MIDLITTIIQPIPPYSSDELKERLENLKISAIAGIVFSALAISSIFYFGIAAGGLVATASLFSKIIVLGVGSTTCAIYFVTTSVVFQSMLNYYEEIKIERIHEKKINQINNHFGQLLDDAAEYFGMEKKENRAKFLTTKPKLTKLFQKASEEERKTYNDIALFIGRLQQEAISGID